VDSDPAWSGDADPELRRIAEHVAKLAGVVVHPITAAELRQHYVDRAKNPAELRNRTRFTITCLTREEPIVLQNYLDTGRWSA
jgi:hypothetical protein